MGGFLDRPKTEKECDGGEGNGLNYGLASMQGWRCEMEDAHHALIGLPHRLSDWSFFAVFDGHAGAKVSAHCATNLLSSIMANDEFLNYANSANNNSITDTGGGGTEGAAGAASGDSLADSGKLSPEQTELVKRAIHDGFLRLDEKMKNLPEVESGEDKSGSTAVAALVSPTHIWFANCGDSRAVLSSGGRALYSTEDHKPVNPAEKDRIQKAGGSVMIQRVNGSLAVSRALGDYEYKQVQGKGPCEQLVSPEPEIHVHVRNPAEDEFMVIACDGVWDVMQNEELCHFIRHQLTVTHDLKSICSSIIDTCLHKGSRDNMSVVLVTFPGAPPLSPEAQQKEAQLNKYLEKRTEEILKESPSISLYALNRVLMNEFTDQLPPGGGIDAKRQLITDVFERLSTNKNPNASEPSTPADSTQSFMDAVVGAFESVTRKAKESNAAKSSAAASLTSTTTTEEPLSSSSSCVPSSAPVRIPSSTSSSATSASSAATVAAVDIPTSTTLTLADRDKSEDSPSPMELSTTPPSAAAHLLTSSTTSADEGVVADVDVGLDDSGSLPSATSPSKMVSSAVSSSSTTSSSHTTTADLMMMSTSPPSPSPSPPSPAPAPEQPLQQTPVSN